jgi:hypothetical protein
MMGVAIGSATLGSLALLWSFVCVIFRSIGAHPRASELLIALTVLTGYFWIHIILKNFGC